jgi:hypothetical protein
MSEIELARITGKLDHARVAISQQPYVFRCSSAAKGPQFLWSPPA